MTQKLAMIGKQLNYKNLDFYRNKNILVTGGSGYIGSSLVKQLKKATDKIIALSSKTDIRNKKVWKKLLRKVDVLFHFAAQTSSRVSNENPLLDAAINFLPIINIIETCQKNDYFPDIIFAGTVTQAGLTKTYPVNEKFKDRPITVYDINKLAAEKYLQYYSNQLGRRAVTLRLANVYGPGPASSSADRGILNLFIKKALRGKPLTIYGKGNFVRDYIYIDDVVNAFLVTGTKIDILKGNYYIIGSGRGYTIKKMATLIRDQVAKRTGKKVKVISIAPPKDLSFIERRNFVADSSKFKKATEWQAQYSLEQGIKNTIDFFCN